MAGTQPDGPQISKVPTSSNKAYYPIRLLLDELQMKDKEERLQFTNFLKEYLSWDAGTKQGFTKKEHVLLPDSCMFSYATQFLDSATIEPEMLTPEVQKSTAGRFFFPQPDVDVGPNFSPHLKQWNYAQHRDNIIACVSAIMVTQKRNVAEGLRQQQVKSKRLRRERREIQRDRRAAIHRQHTPDDFSFDTDSDIGSDCPMNDCSSSIASPRPSNGVEPSTRNSISRQSTISSNTNTNTNTSGRPVEVRDTVSPQSFAPTLDKSVGEVSTAAISQPIINGNQDNSRSSSTPTIQAVAGANAHHDVHHDTEARATSSASSATLLPSNHTVVSPTNPAPSTTHTMLPSTNTNTTINPTPGPTHTAPPSTNINNNTNYQPTNPTTTNTTSTLPQPSAPTTGTSLPPISTNPTLPTARLTFPNPIPQPLSPAIANPPTTTSSSSSSSSLSSSLSSSSASTATEAPTMSLTSPLTLGLIHARRLCMEKHCEQQIAARSLPAGGPEQNRLLVRSAGVLDMLVVLEQALKEDRDGLGRLLSRVGN